MDRKSDINRLPLRFFVALVDDGDALVVFVFASDGAGAEVEGKCSLSGFSLSEAAGSVSSCSAPGM